MVMERFGDLTLYDRVPKVGEGITHDELLVQEFATVTAPLEEVHEFVVREARVRPGFHELVERYEPLVISGAFHEIIEPVLEREGVSVELLANRIDAEPRGLAGAAARRRGLRGLRRRLQACRPPAG